MRQASQHRRDGGAGRDVKAASGPAADARGGGGGFARGDEERCERWNGVDAGCGRHHRGGEVRGLFKVGAAGFCH